jgi:Flp pilus assembly protein TadG
MVILVPVVLVVFALVVAFGRTTTATEHVAHAAAVGARAAASAQTAGGATALATDVVADALAQVGMTCGAPSVAGTFRPGGSVTVTVSCTVDLGDLSELGMIPGSRTLTASATEVIDRTRGGGA